MLPEFRLERWLRAQEKRARFAIGGSGVARGDIAPYVGDPARDWATHPDDAVRAVREAVAREHGVDAAGVWPCAGASEADAAVVLGLAGPGAHVLVEKPAYHALVHPALAFGCRVERVERDAGFALDANRVIGALRGDTKLVILARPNNPTGAVVPRAELERIADAAARVGAWVLVDEVFADATELEHPACRFHPRILSVDSLTKTLGFSHLRCGWVAGAPEAIEAVDRAKAVLSVNNAMLDLLIGARVLADRKRLIERTRALRRANAQALGELLAEAKHVTGRVPEHGTTALLRLPPGVDDVAFCDALAAQHGVVAPPGTYVEMPGFVRVGLVGDTGALREGLRLLDPFAGRWHEGAEDAKAR